MDDLSIDFGSKTRRLRLTLADGAELQGRFAFKAAADWLIKDVLGVIPSIPTNSGGDLDAQMTALAIAINRAAGPSSKVSQIQTTEWASKLMEAIAEGKAPEDAFKQVLWTLFRTAHRSGWPQQKPVDPEEKMPELKRLFFAETVEDLLEKLAEETPETSSTLQRSAAVPAAE